MLTGRPYAVDWTLDQCAAVVQVFFPGEEGAAAVAGVLSGRVNPSGRLPLSLPRSAGAQPYTYLHPPLGGPSSVSNVATAPALPFGHGLSYTTFTYGEFKVLEEEVDTAASIRVTVDVRNTGDRPGAEVVQLYGHDLVASITRPVAQLLAYARVDLEPGETATVRFTVPSTRLAFSDRDMRRIVEPGDIELWVGRSCAERVAEARVKLVGDNREVKLTDARWAEVELIRTTA
jgi:beta-glucosidase